MPSAKSKIATASPPVFHPDHPHNRNPSSFTIATTSTPLAPAYHPNIPGALGRTRRQSSKAGTGLPTKSPGGMSDSDASVGSSPIRRRCFCGREVVDDGIYCSIDCARSDAFSSLCYKPGGPSSISAQLSRQPSLESALSVSLSRQPSSSAASTISTISESAADVPEWNASHYRRMARSDARREERRDERRRRRAEGSVASSAVSRANTYSTVSTVSSTSSSGRVPDLIHSHSRNASTASSASSSGWSGSTLSRNPSSASTMSSASRRYRGDGVAVIQEDDDEEEFLDNRPYPLPGRNNMPLPGFMGIGTGHKKSRSGHSRKRIAEPMGMGKDMRDILEEIISMEKSFNVDDDGLAGAADEDDHRMQVGNVNPHPGLFTATFDKPPRTPSPVAPSRRKSVIPSAPFRGHRSTMSNPLGSPHLGLDPSLHQQQHPRQQRPPSLMGLHQSSLSESHTALYLATASPVQSRRSASPQLRSRNSMTFTPESAGPIISGVSGGRFDTPLPSAATATGQLSTPSRRRPQISPNASYAAMDGWRFPGMNIAGGVSTPKGPQIPVSVTQPAAIHQARRDQPERIAPHLLWPAPPLFPQSPGVDTPTFISALHTRPGFTGHGQSRLSPPTLPVPTSGMKLGVLLGSGEVGNAEDIEMDMEAGDEDDDEEDDEGSTAHGHEDAYGGMERRGRSQYLPVFLEAEGFRQTGLWGGAQAQA